MSIISPVFRRLKSRTDFNFERKCLFTEYCWLFDGLYHYMLHLTGLRKTSSLLSEETFIKK